MTKAEKEIYLKNRLEEMKTLERELYAKGYSFVAGVDDSKKVTEKKRNELYDLILENAVCYGIGEKDNTVIDDINILEATKLAMRDAVAAADRMLKEKTGENIDYVLFDAMTIPEVEKPQSSIIKGDAKSVSIAAASIVAKVYRDRMMVDYDTTYPGYGFASNKGYGTKVHYEGLDEKGLTPIHRRSFLKKYINK